MNKYILLKAYIEQSFYDTNIYTNTLIPKMRTSSWFCVLKKKFS